MSHFLLKKSISKTIIKNKKTQSCRLQALTNAVTSDIMSLIHKRTTKLYSSSISREDYFSFDPKTNTLEFYEIIAGHMPLSMDWVSYKDSELEDTTIFVTLEIDRNSEKFNISGEDKDPMGTGRLGFTIAVELLSEMSSEDYKITRDQVANSVRHEIEHITQGEASDQDFLAFGRNKEYYSFINSAKEAYSDYAKYLLRPEEIPAFVRGEAHNSKNIEQLKSNMEDFLNGYMELSLIQKKEKLIILDTWLDWATRHIHRKGY